MGACQKWDFLGSTWTYCIRNWGYRCFWFMIKFENLWSRIQVLPWTYSKPIFLPFIPLYLFLVEQWASLVAQMVKNPPAIWETWVWSLGLEDPLEKKMATPSVFLPEESPWIEEPGRLQSMVLQRVGHDWATSLSFLMKTIKRLN